MPLTCTYDAECQICGETCHAAGDPNDHSGASDVDRWMFNGAQLRDLHKPYGGWGSDLYYCSRNRQTPVVCNLCMRTIRTAVRDLVDKMTATCKDKSP